MSCETPLEDLLKDKKVLFISTKNIDYLRNTQEIEIIQNYSNSSDIIAFSDKSYLKRILKVYLKCLKILASKKYDVIFIGFAPQLLLPFLGLFSKKRTLIIDFFISVYDTLVFDRKKINEKSIFSKIIHSIDKKTIQKSDFVIADTKAHQKYFIEEFGLSPEKSQVLYLKADEKIYYPREQIKPESLKNKFIVLYFGSILPLQGVDVVLKAADILKNNENIYFYIIGPLNKMQSDAYSTLSNAEFIPWLSQEKLAEKISQADLCLAGHFCNTIEKAKRTIPGKAYIYRAMKKPMILGDGPANHELFDESERDGIYFSEMGSSKKLAELIEKISESRLN